jgi:hypothetical protein
MKAKELRGPQCGPGVSQKTKKITKKIATDPVSRTIEEPQQRVMSLRVYRLAKNRDGKRGAGRSFVQTITLAKRTGGIQKPSSGNCSPFWDSHVMARKRGDFRGNAGIEF